MKTAFKLAAAVTATASLSIACQLLVGVKDEEENRRPEAGAASDGGVDATPRDAGSACAHPRPPGPPANAALTPSARHVFAVRRIRIGGWDEPGLGREFDFDNRCTCENREPEKSPTSCKQPGDPCSPLSDDPEGRDLGGRNALGAATAIASGLETEDINPRFETGVASFLITVAGYNGTPNDTLVEVGLSVSNGVYTSSAYEGRTRTTAEACAGLEMEGGVEPAWDGKDKWYRVGSGAALTQGHVRDGLVVVDGATNAYELSLAGQRLRQSRSVFNAKIEGAPGKLKLHGNLVGLVKASDLLSAVGSFQAPGYPLGTRLCTTPLLNLFTAPICQNRDLSDEQDPTAACDALALAFGIDAEEIDASESPDPACPPVDAGAPCNVTCDGGG